MACAVSVVIPAYNAARFVSDAVASVLAQSFAPAELLVVDDGSSDGTAEVAKRSGARCLRLETNRGQAVALNRGIAATRSAFVAFLDADDVWRERKLERQLAAFEANPGLGLVYGLAEERVLEGAVHAPARNGRVLTAHLPSALLARRSALDIVGAFDERWRVGSVVDWYARAVAANVAVHVVPEVVYERRIHGRNLGLARDTNQRDDYLSVVRAALARKRV